MKRCTRQPRSRNSHSFGRVRQRVHAFGVVRRTLGKRTLSSQPKLRISPFGLLVTNIEEANPPRQRSKHALPCHRDSCRRYRKAAANSWLALCIQTEESEAEDAEDRVSIH